MTAAQVAVADYCPNWWPAATRLLIRRVRLDLDRGQVSADPRARRRRTLHPDQRALPLAELAECRHRVFGYSFIVTNLDVSTGEKAARWSTGTGTAPRSRTCSATPNTAPRFRHLPSGHQAVNRAWMWGALLAATLPAGCTSSPPPPSRRWLLGHGVREGQAMIATLRRRLIRVPARLVRHAGALILRLPPGYELLDEVLARIRSLPAPS